MKAEVAVATVSGKAYYKIVEELKKRRISFVSLVPGDPIYPSIQVVITTEKEKELMEHSNILTVDSETDPSDVVNKAMRIAMSKDSYEEVVIGVDPGKTFGVAVLGDGKVLRAEDQLTIERTVDIILTELKRNPSRIQKIRIGSGVPETADELARRLRMALPLNASIEIVGEANTSSVRRSGIPKKLSDADSAKMIAEERGGSKVRRNNP